MRVAFALLSVHGWIGFQETSDLETVKYDEVKSPSLKNYFTQVSIPTCPTCNAPTN